MSRAMLWLVGTGLAAAVATLGIVGLLAHVDEGRETTVIAFDVLWIVASTVVAIYTFQRYRSTT